ncbi:MAG: HU family DNA-binding protein [Paludibacteraceae bacterium]|nr:HU family DNA-binding protein [Paludibacteraceae bacterium]
MSKEKISTQELAELLSEKAGITKKAADDFIRQLFSTIEDSLLAGEQVKIKNLGTFKLQWNEPRKSVNVQTGEEIILSGYNKINFTPDAGLKEIVNEPYAHLEAVVLDGEETQTADLTESNDTENEMGPFNDPLRIFTEQAEEIKNLLVDINSLSAKNETTEVKGENEAIDEAAILIDKEANDTNQTQSDHIPVEGIINEPITVDIPEPVEEIIEEVEEEKVTEVEKISPLNAEYISTNSSENELKEDQILTQPTKVTENEQETHTDSGNSQIPPTVSNSTTKDPRRRKPFFKRVWVWVIIIITLIITATTITYYSSSCVSCWFTYKILNDNQRVKFNKATDTLEAFTRNVFSVFQSDTNVEAPQTDSTLMAINTPDTVPVVIAEPKPVQHADSIDILLSKPRIYTEFIGTERIVKGSRLARISERYYGTRDFWVYIYEANKERIDNPDLIPVGTLIKIPKVDARLLDAKNPKVMSKARELHDIYVGKK